MKNIIFGMAGINTIEKKYLYSRCLMHVKEPTISLARLINSCSYRAKGCKVPEYWKSWHDVNLYLDGIKLDSDTFNQYEAELLLFAIYDSKTKYVALDKVSKDLCKQKLRQDLMLKLALPINNTEYPTI